jgi:PAS domain-containing protein
MSHHRKANPAGFTEEGLSSFSSNELVELARSQAKYIDRQSERVSRLGQKIRRTRYKLDFLLAVLEFFNDSAIIDVFKDDDHIFTYGDMLKITGYSHKEIRKKGGHWFINNVVHKEDRQALTNHLERVSKSKTGEKFTTTFRIIHGTTGEVRWIMSTDGKFNLRGYVAHEKTSIGVAMDVTSIETERLKIESEKNKKIKSYLEFEEGRRAIVERAMKSMVRDMFVPCVSIEDGVGLIVLSGEADDSYLSVAREKITETASINGFRVLIIDLTKLMGDKHCLSRFLFEAISQIDYYDHDIQFVLSGFKVQAGDILYGNSRCVYVDNVRQGMEYALKLSEHT